MTLPEDRAGEDAVVTIALDVLGGDAGPEVVADAALQVLTSQPGIALILVGPSELTRQLAADRSISDRVEIVHADSAISMDEDPVRAIRNRPQVSVNVAAELVHNSRAGACVSIGHTGGVLAAATLTIGRLPGVTRAAVAVVVPAVEHDVVLLDVGGTVDATPELLAQFAHLGHAFAQALELSDDPTVGLLTIGSEPGKGDALRRLAHEQLLALPLRYIGAVEGDDVAIGGKADVVVTDGFTGNVVLKALEGAAINAATQISKRYADPAPALEVGQSFAIGAHAGAVLLGIDGVSVVGHGASTAGEVAAYVALAARVVRHDLVARTAAELSDTNQ
ncbi:MAG: phosphate acyltransferase PlsX [Actinomycetes bacterium]|jgi:glycerol-3-phosphate acyltransferase PlsX